MAASKRRSPTPPAGRRAAAREPRVRLDVDERRAQLVELGLERFGALPYDEVSIDDIARAAGISKGLLYHYFPTKRAFYGATIREAARRLLASTDGSARPAPLERLQAGLDAYLTFVRAHARAYATLMKSGVGVDPEIARILDEVRDAFVARILADVAPDGAGGVASNPATPALSRTPRLDLALRGWVGLCETVSLAWLAALEAHRPAPSQGEVRDLLAQALLDLLLRQSA